MVLLSTSNKLLNEKYISKLHLRPINLCLLYREKNCVEQGVSFELLQVFDEKKILIWSFITYKQKKKNT